VYAQRDLSGRLLLRLTGRAARPRRISLRLVVILLARHGPPATTIAGLPDCDPATIRRRSTAINPRHRWACWPAGSGSASAGSSSPWPADPSLPQQTVKGRRPSPAGLGIAGCLRLRIQRPRRIATWGRRGAAKQRSTTVNHGAPRTTKPPAVSR